MHDRTLYIAYDRYLIIGKFYKELCVISKGNRYRNVDIRYDFLNKIISQYVPYLNAVTEMFFEK